jgi:hypothetical protein
VALHIGSRWRNFFFQGGIDWRQLEYIPLPSALLVHPYVNLPNTVMTNQQNHSLSRDERFSGRVGWTPKPGMNMSSATSI